jgi:hypothetical protein
MEKVSTDAVDEQRAFYSVQYPCSQSKRTLRSRTLHVPGLRAAEGTGDLLVDEKSTYQTQIPLPFNLNESGD